MIFFLNFAAVGLLLGLIASAAVELLSMRFPRAATVGGTVIFPFVAVAPFLRFAGDVALPLDDRRADAIATIICCTISAALVAREVVSHLRAARHRREWVLATRALRDSAGVDELYVKSDEPPGTHGIFRRCIVVPSNGVHRSVLLHEREHLVWFHPMMAALRRLIRAALWFHPGLVLFDRSTALASELAADAAALAATSSTEREAFAALLVSTARSLSSGTGLGAPRATDLEVRVRAALGCGDPRRAITRTLMVAGALALVPLVPHFVAADHVVVIHDVIRIR